MSIEKVTSKLNDFFALSKDKRLEDKHQKNLLKCINKLERKRLEIEEQLQLQTDQNCEQYDELSKRRKILKKLIKKAKKHYLEKL